MIQWIVLGLAPLGLYAQYAQWSGIINSYTQVTNIVGSNLTVTQSTGFSVGDRVLLIQMKGGQVTLPNDENYGNITDIQQVGRYEINTISSISGNTITLGCAPSFPYDISLGRVQLVRVAYAPNATIIGTVTAPDWNGFTGGVVAIEVPGTLTLNAPINVDFLGYRGGPEPTVASPNCWSNIDCWGADTANTYAGVKGEGVVITSAGHTACRGKMANGGGGGNSHNRGGGGGGNYGTGGLGGCTVTGSTCGSCVSFPDGGQCTNQRSGRGGSSLSGYIGGSRLFMGGGGGSGDQNNDMGGRGGHGGGIILIVAGTLQGNGQTLSARGEKPPSPTPTEDGAGGGGGGGCIALFYNTFAGPLTLDVRGGEGGDVISTFQSPRDYGPGGGGGGGYVLLGSPSVPPGLTVQTAGGTAGIETGLACANFPAQRAATDGTAGAVLTGASLPISCPLSWHIDFSLHTTLQHAHLAWEVQAPESLRSLSLEIQNLEKPYYDLIPIPYKGKYTFYVPYQGEWHLSLWATHSDGKRSLLRRKVMSFTFPDMPKILYREGIPHLSIPRPQHIQLITPTGQQLWQRELPAGMYSPEQLAIPPGFYLLKTEENTLPLLWRP